MPMNTPRTPLVPLAQQIRCVQREIAMRQRVYPGAVAAGRMTQAAADSQMAAMQAVLATLEGLLPHQGALWPEEDDQPCP